MAKYTNVSWIAAAEKKYPGRFSYEHTRYVDSYHKVLVKCLIDGEVFEVSPISFIRASAKGDFCPKCRVNKKLTNVEFVSRAKQRHPLINFDKAEYKGSREKITLGCQYHGEFVIQAKKVLHGQNEICPECIKENNFKRSFDWVKFYSEDEKGKSPGTFYKIKVTHRPSGISFIKIGITSVTSYKRYEDKKYSDFEFEVIDEIHTTNLDSAILERKYKEENKLKRFYLPKDIWFGGRTECYEFDGYYQLKYSQVKFVRDSILQKQNGVCPLCKNEVLMPTLDHYHSKKQHGSGLVRGVLCNTCNRMAGVVENNFARNCIDYSDGPEFLRLLADYLESKRERYMYPSEKPKPPKLMKSSYNKLVKAVNGKQKVPKYTGKFTKTLEKLFEKYEVTPAFKKSSVSQGKPEDHVQE